MFYVMWLLGLYKRLICVLTFIAMQMLDRISWATITSLYYILWNSHWKMANLNDISNTYGLKRKNDINIEEFIYVPKKLSSLECSKNYNKQQNERLRLMNIKVNNITKHKLMEINDSDECLHRCVLLNNTRVKLQADIANFAICST